MVLLQKVIRSVLEGLGHALPDSDAGDHHDELAPAVALVQLEHRLDVTVGLAGARLHLDVEVHRTDGRTFQDA